MRNWGIILLRLGLASVFLWFGVEQLINPLEWIGFVPDFASKFFLNTTQIVLINGLFETLGATLLILGVYTRLIALLLGLHMLGIAISIGINPIGVRDFGLAFATISLGLIGYEKIN